LRRTGPTNIRLRKLISMLKKKANETNAAIWDYVAELLSLPSRRRVVVNISKIQRYANDGDVIVVPGKVLGAGVLNKKVTVAAVTFSMKALEKINLAGGRVLTIEELLSQNPKGSGVKVIT